MLKPYILQRVSLPQKRLLVNQASLPISISGLMMGLIFNQYILGAVYFIISHGVLIYLTHKDPYFMQVLFAKMRFQGQAKTPATFDQNLTTQGNIYEC